MNKLKRITKNYLWVWNVRNPTLLEYFLNYYGIDYYIKDIPMVFRKDEVAIPNAIWLDALTKENKRILQDFIFMYVDAQYEENKMHYYPKYYR
jgi:hypothetical protein